MYDWPSQDIYEWTTPLTTKKVINELANRPDYIREVIDNFDGLWNEVSQVANHWKSVNGMADVYRHPLEDLIDALYHDLCSAAYHSERKLVDKLTEELAEMTETAKDLGFGDKEEGLGVS